MKRSQQSLNQATAQMQEVGEDLVNLSISIIILKIEHSFALYLTYLFIYWLIYLLV